MNAATFDPQPAAPPAAGQGASPFASRFQALAALASGAIAFAVLAGWASGLDRLTSILPKSIAMNPMTAVAVLALSLGLWCRSPAHVPLVRGLAGVAIAIGTIKFGQFLLGTPDGIDQLLFTDQLDRIADTSLNRMAPNTAFALAMIGCGLMWSGVRDPRGVTASQLCGVAAAAIALVAAVGYALDVVALYQVQYYIAMALPTTIVLLTLSLAVISINPHIGLGRIIADRGPAGLLARTALPFAVLAPLTIGVIDSAAQQAGMYDREVAGALALLSNIVVNFLLLGGCIVALFASDEQRRKREAAIAQSEDHYRQAERVGHVGYWKIDAATRQVQWSDGFLQICGLDPATHASVEAIIAVCHPDDAAQMADVIGRPDCGSWQFDCRIRRPDGETRFVRSQGVCASDADGLPAAILGVFSDITELEVARQAAETAKETTASFLANMSHEIRTPMNGVMGFVELLLKDDLTDRQRRHLGLIQDSAQALLKLLNDILDISKIEAGRLEIASVPYNIRHGISQCVRLMTPMAEQKGLDLTLSIAENVPSTLVVDGLRMRQILLNLVGNAVKFTAHGKVAVSVSRATSRGRSQMLQVEVRDTGVGIPRERLDSIFEPFIQAEGSTTRRFGGSGLGLSISRSLAEMMGGAIRVDSQVGQGTAMTLVLPWRTASAAARDDDAATVPAVARADGRRSASILLVEDLDLNRILFGEMLADMGHRVTLGEDGAHACALTERLDRDPGAWDLILMDLQMPVMDGLAATRCIRARGGRSATIPIVALTASAFADEIAECHAAGMTDHLSKPVSIAGLRGMIDRWVGATASAPVAAIAPNQSLDARFTARCRDARERLAVIASALAAADPDERASLILEAGNHAHVLSGCAAMFGHPALGTLAATLEQQLRTKPTAAIEPALHRLIAALDHLPARDTPPARCHA